MHKHKPAVGAVLARSCFAGEVAARVEAAAQVCAGSVVHHAAHHVGQLDGHVGVEHAPFVRTRVRQEVGEQLAVGALDAVDHDRRAAHAARGDRGVGARHLEQRHLRGAQRQRRHRPQIRLDAQAPRRPRQVARPDVVDEAYGDRVGGRGERVFERHVLARRAARGVLGRPRLAVDLERGRRVGQAVGRRPALFERPGVQERLERGARLAPRARDVVVGGARVGAAAHPDADGAGRRVHGRDGQLEAHLDGADAVAEGAVGFELREHGVRVVAGGDGALVAARVAHEGVGGARTARPELGERLDAARPVLVGRRRLAEQAAGRARPLHVGDGLQGIAEAAHGLVGGLLEAPVERRVHHQPVAVEVVAVALGPALGDGADVLGEVGRLGAAQRAALEAQAQRLGLPRVYLGGRRAAGHLELGQHHVAPRQRALGALLGVVGRCAFEHAHERGRLGRGQLGGRDREVGLRRALDADGVVQERHRVEVQLEDLVLVVDALDLERRDGLFELARDAARAADALREQVARELLRECRATLRRARQRAHDRADGAAQVHAAVRVEAAVLGGDERLHDGLGDLVQAHPVAPGALEERQFGAVGGEHARGRWLLSVAQAAHTRRKRHQREREQQHADAHHRRADGAQACQSARGPRRAAPARQLGVAHAAPDEAGAPAEPAHRAHHGAPQRGEHAARPRAHRRGRCRRRGRRAGRHDGARRGGDRRHGERGGAGLRSRGPTGCGRRV